VTFTSADVPKSPDSGYCNGAGSLALSGSSISFTFAAATPTRATSATGVSLPVTLGTAKSPSHTVRSSSVPTNSIAASGNNTVAVGSTSHSHSHVAIGAGVGVSMGASLVILTLAFLFVHRRRARKARGTIGTDVMVSRSLDGDESKSGKDGNEKG
jgi:hypothetical protein